MPKGKGAKGKKKKAQKVVEEDPNKPHPPPGCVSLFLSMKQMADNDLKVGEGVMDTVPFKMFDLHDSLDEIQRLGFYALFYPVQKELETYDHDSILLISDNEKKYGENWYVCVTGEAFDRELGIFHAREEEIRQARLREEQEAARRLREEEEEAKRIYEVTPIFSRFYESSSESETAKYIAWLNVRSSRPKIEYSFHRRRQDFNQSYTLNEIDAESCDEFRQHKDPNFSLTRMIHDIGLQDTPSLFSRKQDVGVQSHLTRSVNVAIQYEPQKLSDSSIAEQLASPGVSQFLKRVEPLVRQSMQENELMNPFLDEFQRFPPDDSSLGNMSDSTISSIRVFTDLEHSKGKCLPSLCWHPKKRDIVACSVTETFSHEQRMKTISNPPPSYVLIWSFDDLIHPIMILQSHFELTCFRFHPKSADIVIGGCTTGQVVMWDLRAAWQERDKSAKKPSENAPRVVDPLKSPYIQPDSYSVHDRSHTRSVGDLKWMPAHLEINRRGQLTKKDSEEITQFVTCSSDGGLCVWDSDFRALSHKTAQLRGQRLEESDITWFPRYSYVIDIQNQEPGTASLSRLLLPSEQDLSDTKLRLATERGVLISADFRGEDGLVQWFVQDHHRPIGSLERSPFFPDIYLTVSTWAFHIWRRDIQTSIFSSPRGVAEFTVGKWSPTRPGVIYIGRVDGHLEIWDFTDQSYTPSLVHPVCPNSILSMEFRITKESPRQYLALGDTQGNLHVLAMPSSLRKSLPNEESFIASHFDRESQRVFYQKDITKHIEVKPGFSSTLQKKTKEEAKADAVSDDSRKNMILEKIQMDYEKIEHKILLDFGLIDEEQDGKKKDKDRESS